METDMVRNDIVNIDRPHQDILVVSPGFNTNTLMEIRMDKKRFPRLCQYTREEAVYKISQIVLTAFQYRGQQADPQNIAFIASNLVDELAADLDGYGTKFITLEEISRVIKRAVLGQGKEMFGISFASLYSAIVDYCKGEGHEIEKQIQEIGQRKREQELKDSIIAPMLQSYAGALIKHSKP